MEISPNHETLSLTNPLFKATLIRHEEPYYKDIGHDLTPPGVERAIKIGKKLKKDGRISENDNLILFHSPQVRTRGTLESIAEGAGIPHDSKMQIDQLRRSDFNDFEAFMARVLELNFDQEAIAEDHYKNPLYEQRPDIIEPTSSKRKRLYRALEYLIRSFDKKQEDTGKTPHIIAVSHHEILTHLIDDVFGIENIGRFNAPAFGEIINLDAYRTDSPDKILLQTSFNNESKKAYFNRKERAIEPVR